MHIGPVHKKNILIPCLVVLFSAWIMVSPLPAQITSASANHLDSLAYPVKEGKDPLFVFFQRHGTSQPGSLTASLPGSGNYSYEWSRYNPAISGFDPPFASLPPAPSSTVDDLQDGGYRVRIFDGTDTDTALMAWILLDGLSAEVDKTGEGKLDPKWYDCDRLALNGYVSPDTLLYYDPLSNDTLTRVLNFRFRWTSDNDELRIPNDTIILAPNITYAPPFEDTWYILTVTDEMAMTEIDSVFYESIQTRAVFRVSYLNKYSGEFDSTLTAAWTEPDDTDWTASTGSTDATLTVRFINESRNGARFEWVFLDTLGGIKETETTYGLDEMPEFTYVTADKYYYPYLYSYSEEGCVDSAKHTGIQVPKSQLVIPNVFTPNGDGRNDVFIFKHQSLHTCRVTIMDRTGKVVYKREIDDIYSWQGWDGNLHDSNRRAPEGQYYFVVQAMGYDGLEYKDPTIWETMKLFGGQGSTTGGTGGTGGTGTGGTGTEEEPTNLYTGWLYLFRH